MLDIIRRNSQSWAVKVIFALIIIVFVFWGASAVNTPPVNVIATVNGESIYGKDFEQAFYRSVDDLREKNQSFDMTDEVRAELTQRAISELVYTTLVKQNAEKYGLAASDYEYTQSILAAPEFRDAEGNFSRETYDAYFKIVGPQMGITEDSYSDSLTMRKLYGYISLATRISEDEARLIYNYNGERRTIEYVLFQAEDYLNQVNPEESAIAEYYESNKWRFSVSTKADLEYITVSAADLGSRIQVNEEELQKFYEARSSAFVEPMLYHSSHILIKAPFGVDESDQELKDARAKLDKALAELAAGKEFELVAQKYSDDAETSKNGGELGWMSMGQYAPAYEAAVETMKEGELSQPVRTLNGFHIIRLEAVQEERVKPLEEVREQVTAFYREAEGSKALRTELDAVRDSITLGASFEKIAEKYGLSPVGTGLVDAGLLPERLDVPAESLSGLSALKSGDILPTPLEKADSFMVVRAKEVQPEFVRPLTEVRAEIVATLKEQGASKLAFEAAKAAADEIAASGSLPQRFADKVRRTSNTSRQFGVPELSVSPELAVAVFTEPVGAWLKNAYTVKDGAAVLMVKESLLPTAPEWIKDSYSFTSVINQLYQEQLAQIYQESLRLGSDVSIVNPNPFGR